MLNLNIKLLTIVIRFKQIKPKLLLKASTRLDLSQDILEMISTHIFHRNLDVKSISQTHKHRLIFLIIVHHNDRKNTNRWNYLN